MVVVELDHGSPVRMKVCGFIAIIISHVYQWIGVRYGAEAIEFIQE